LKMDFDWETKPPFLDITTKMKLFVYQFELKKIEKEMKTFLRGRRKKIAPQIFWGRIMVMFD